jgi:hypothetical protein
MEARTDDELREASRHLHYEYGMLVRSASLLTSGALRGNIMEAMALESFLIHVRGLIDFFYPRKTVKEDDVLARHYFDPEDEWARRGPDISAALE